MAKMGEYIFYRRSGPQDFSCTICHGQEGKRIRLQDLGNLTTKDGAGYGDEDLAVLPGLARRRVDHAAPPDRLHAPGALAGAELPGRFDHRAGNLPAKTATGTVMETPGIKR